MPILELSKARGVVLDFDGVLADTRKLHDRARTEAFRLVAKEIGDERYDVSDEVQKEAHSHGSTPPQIIGWVLQQQGVVGRDADLHTDPNVAAMVRRKRAIYRSLMRQDGIPIAGISQLVRRLMPRFPGRLAIATTAYRADEVLPFITRHGLHKYFPDRLMVAHEEVDELDGEVKPSPFLYSLAAKRLGFANNPQSLLAIEDEFAGIESAKRAGLIAGGLATTHTIEELESAHGLQRADYIARDAEDVGVMLGLK